MRTPEVKVGQVWKDNDKRGPDRYLKILQLIPGERVLVRECNKNGSMFIGVRHTEISIRRLRPTSTGYRLISEEIK